MTQSLTLPSSLPATGNSLDAYLSSIAHIDVLTMNEERELALRFAEQNDLQAAQQLVLCHLRFVAYIAKNYQGYGLPLSDLIQEGNIGLMKAIKRFDPHVGVRLVSFAVHWIRSEIHEYVIRNWRLVKVATTKAQRKLFFNLRKMRGSLSWLNADERHAIAKDLNVKLSDVVEMEKRLLSTDTSFDAPVDASEEEAFYPSEYLAAPEPSPEEIVEQSQLQQFHHGALSAAMSQLSERSQAIIQARFLSEDKITLQKLSEQFGVSRERIRQLEAQALAKLQQAMQPE